MEKEYFEPTPEDWAQMAEQANKMYIDSFTQYYNNVVDSTVEKSLLDLRDSYKENYRKYFNMVRKFSSPESEEDYIRQAEEKYYASRFHSESLKTAFALYELRILYAYKYFEIKLHELSRIAYYDWNGNYRWKSVLKAYMNRGITIEKLSNYKSLDEFRRINNSLKHSGDKVTEEIVNIAEFEGLKYFEIDHLKAFYERVKDAPYNFISELSTVVYKRLWPDEESTNIDHEFESFDGQEIEF